MIKNDSSRLLSRLLDLMASGRSSLSRCDFNRRIFISYWRIFVSYWRILIFKYKIRIVSAIRWPSATTRCLRAAGSLRTLQRLRRVKSGRIFSATVCARRSLTVVLTEWRLLHPQTLQIGSASAGERILFWSINRAACISVLHPCCLCSDGWWYRAPGPVGFTKWNDITGEWCDFTEKFSILNEIQHFKWNSAF